MVDVNYPGKPSYIVPIILVIVFIVIAVGAFLVWKYVIQPRTNTDDGGGGGGGGGGGTCTTPPPIPTDLTASVNQANINLSWTASTGAASYKIIYSKTNPVTQANSIAVSTSNVTNKTLANLIVGTYYIAVASVNTCGSSNYSPQVSAVITVFPNKFKICKRNSPSLCVWIDTDLDSDIKLSSACPAGGCDLTRTDGNNLSLFPGGARCIEHRLDFPYASLLESQNCAPFATTSDNWIIDVDSGQVKCALSLGFVTGVTNPCLSAPNVPETLLTIAECNVLDPNQVWDVVPLL